MFTSRNQALAASIVGESYINQSKEAEHQREGAITTLLSQRALPSPAWSQSAIETFILELSAMDTNNFKENCGAGEREGRVFSSIVRSRHFGLAHGIGRSGDIGAIQPKAAGSSLISKAASFLAQDALRIAGFAKPAVKGCLVLPVATGMAMTLCLLTLRQKRGQAKYVLWSRVDQKSCLKAIYAAGLGAITIPTKLVDDGVTMDVDALTEVLRRTPAEDILCVMSNTSAFAPRIPDAVPAIAAVCKEHDVPHIINNAFGVQSSRACGLISAAASIRVTAVVQSTDKNFMVPVGGSVVVSPDKGFVKSLSQTYPGRASVAPLLDLLITFLEMGADGYRALLTQRSDLWPTFRERVGEVAKKHGTTVLETEGNTISLGLSLEGIVPTREAASEFGSILFVRGISGARGVSGQDSKQISGLEFQGWGSHIANYPVPYITLSCAMGMTAADLDSIVTRVDQALGQYIAKANK